MRLLQHHADVYIRMLLTEQLDEPAIFSVKEPLDLKHDTVGKDKVRCVATWDHKVVLVFLIFVVHTVGS